MTKKIVLSLTLAAGLLVIGVVALAHGPDYGRGYGMGSGMSGYDMGRGMGHGMGSGVSGYGMGRGMGHGMGSGMSGYGMGHGMGNHMTGRHMGYGSGWTTDGAWKKFHEETANLRKDIYQKRIELRNLLSASEVDITKAKTIQAEINKLQNELSEKRLTAELEFRKDNPNWRTDAQYGHGPGHESELCGS